MEQDHTCFNLGSDTILSGAALGAFAGAYPARPATFSHTLTHHPLLTIDALAAAVERMDPAQVECRRANNANGGGFDFMQDLAGGAAATTRNIASAGCWVMLRFAESLPEYADLLAKLIEEIGPVTSRHGPPLKPRAFIFISSPGTLTPFHFDPEFNILLQIAGTKRFATCPVQAPWLSAAQQQRFHADGDNLLAWSPDLADGATVHRLSPGEALFVPYKAPHWVEVEDVPSISLSLTWSNRTTLELEAAWQFNARLARIGFSPIPPPDFPGRARFKAAMRRGAGKLGWD